MELNLSKEPVKFSLDSAYQHWSRSLIVEDEPKDGRKEAATYLEPIVLKLIVGEEFETIEQARQWLLGSIKDGNYLMDGFESQILAIQTGDDSIAPKVQQKIEQKLNSDEGGDVYALYRISQSLFDQSDIDGLEGRAQILELGQPIQVDRAQFERNRRQVLLRKPPDPIKRGSNDAPIVAIIDDGIGFLNNRFRTGPVKPWGATQTRFHAIWLQSQDTIFVPPFGAFYVYSGQVLHTSEIDALLARGPKLDEDQIYRELNTHVVKPGKHRSTEFSFTHGTHVLDVAAGADPSTGKAEEQWPLLAVQLPPEAVDNTAGTQLEPAIVQGVRWILAQAEDIDDNSAVIINISFGTMAGPKDGTKQIEYLIARQIRLWQHRTGRCARVILSNGNGRLRRQIARFELAPEAIESTTWRLQPDDFTACFAEIRTDKKTDIGNLMVSVTAPSGAAIPLDALPPNTFRELTDAQGRPVARLYHVGERNISPTDTTPAYYLIATAKTSAGPEVRAEAGGWKIELSHNDGAKTIPARIEVQRGETPRGYRLSGRQSYLDDPNAFEWEPEVAEYSLPVLPITRSGTHSSFSTATLNSESIASVGASEGPLFKPARYSGQGAPWTVPSPTASAVAEDLPRRGVLASGTLSGSVRQLNGTSVAAGRMSHSFAMHYSTEGCVPNGTTTMENEMLDILAKFGEIAPPGPDTPQTGLGVVNEAAGSRGPR